MHEQLEEYLAEVARRLASIPKPRRDEELKEMRQHLLNAVSAHQGSGQSEVEATANALMDFGTPEEASTNVLAAWRTFLRKHSFKTYGTIVGIWSILAIFQLLFLSPTPADQHRWLWFWVGVVVIPGLTIVAPHYLPTKAQWQRLAVGRPR